MSHALIPGSFDPMTLGHLDVIKRARKYYDKVTVAVLINESKQYLCSLAEREAIARMTVSAYPDVAVVSDSGLLVDVFDRVGADVIVKGVRNEVDRDYEEKMARANLARNPRAVTVFLEAADDFEDVSSTRVREALAKGESLDGLLHPDVIRYFEQRKENA